MNLKRIIILIIVVVLVLMGIFLFKNKEIENNLTKEEEIYSDYKEYNQNKWDFQVKYPRDWEQKEIEETEESFTVVFISPAEEETDNSIENIIIFATKAEDRDFNIIMKEGKDKLIEGGVINLTEKGITTISGYSAFILEYSILDYTNEFKYLHYFINAEEKWYQILYTAGIDNYEDSLKTVENIINSLIIN